MLSAAGVEIFTSTLGIASAKMIKSTRTDAGGEGQEIWLTSITTNAGSVFQGRSDKATREAKEIKRSMASGEPEACVKDARG